MRPKRFCITIDQSTHRAFSAYCHARGLTIQDEAEKAVRYWVEERHVAEELGLVDGPEAAQEKPVDEQT